MTAIQSLRLSGLISLTRLLALCTLSSRRCLILAAFLCLIGRPGSGNPALAQDAVNLQERVDFSRDIRPILSDHCFQCHGEDEDSRAADLRLDVRDSAVQQKAIDPHDPGSGSLLKRITSRDPQQRMPPAEANKPLTDSEIRLLQQWVLQGAEYEEHWAFQRVERPEVPIASQNNWIRNPIDAFVLQQLENAGLNPSPEADRATLIRRATQDVLGLLPTIPETDAFLRDASPNAWESLVDRLLASPHYGERWGRHWLDQARYADSNGYTIDGPRVMWPYRDWVINAINRDLPFDQFTIEQLAGDLLPNGSKAQKVASAFHRNTMINEEGGVKPDQYRHEATIDRVNTTGAVWLGLTVGCAQCHSHKFDPLSHEEYYRLYAFFNAAADTNNAGEVVDVYADEMLGWTEVQKQQQEELQTLYQTRKQLEEQATSSSALSRLAWNWQPAKVAGVTAAGSIILKIEDDGSVLAKSHPSANDAFLIRIQKSEDSSGSRPVTAVRLRTLTHPALPKNGPGTAANGNFVLTDFSLKAGSVEKRFARAWADHSQPSYPIEHAIDDSNTTGWAINVDSVQAAKGVRMNAPHEAIFTLDDPVAFVDETLTVVMRHDLNKNYLVGHLALDYSTETIVQELPADPSNGELATIRNRIQQLENELPGSGKPVKQMVMRDREKPPETFVLTRGDFLHPDRQRGALKPGVPEFLNLSARSTAMVNRLDLARWLVSRDNPLTARVTVNRVWAKYFGRGLVDTENDFGFQGTEPTHPELLDWLAAEFMEHGWSMKHLHRTILLSAAYRQSSIYPASTDASSADAVDPDNYLLSRQNRFRVEAEIVRDLALVASGLFTPRIGGPGIHLPQPDGIYDFTQNKKDWPTAVGPDRYRRTMYTMFYRSAPYPLLTTFDAPDFSTVCTRRVRSNTPLQSLTVANDIVFTELAVGLAAGILRDHPGETNEELCRVMFRTCLTREPVPEEMNVLLNFFSRELSRFSSSATSAADLVKGRESESDVVILAAWTSVARSLLNTDEFLMRN